MTERLFNMKSLILSGVFLFFAVCDSARAAVDWSYCNADGSINIQNINLRSGAFPPGQELQSVSIPISYTCYTSPKVSGPDYYTTINLYAMGSVVTALRKSGLGMDIIVQEGGGTPVTFTWKEIQAGFSGWSSSKIFGQWMDQGKLYNRRGMLTFRLFVEYSFNNTFVNINIPPSTINILPYNPVGITAPTVPFKPLSVSAFNIRIIPDNSGRVIASPSVIKMGRFYTEYKDTMASREVPFTVTAQQNIGTQSPFVAPLAIEFQTNGLTLADADSSVTLKNTKGEYNGFRLSVIDGAGTPVKFNTKADMGNISLDTASGGKIIKQYKAKVEAIPGAEIKTGNFSAAMTVVVTYI
ncbi:adhesion protein [Salmonella enterica subsp. enterica]|nr:adhesion protein [Salmonella enterica subsp. enterica serovar Mokola]EIC6029369.1 fimbrial protein [Salmonella enterica subsp. enterica serovar Corvallis]HDA4098082.1 fimbrial protein [Salmonella enterica subsp. enterica serovar Mokola]HDA4107164.1 fimbrial protein [Salmonella enterica subsp. enterica serovar Mokola]HDA4157076.1 fimbrial protein [Salmonella enterica subsp. enterica serovar Mokola]